MQKWYACILCLYKCSKFLLASACRYKVVGCLKKQFKTPKDPEDAYFKEQRPPDDADVPATSPTNNSESSLMDLSALAQLFNQLPADIQLNFLSKLFALYTSSELKMSVPEFLKYTIYLI